MYDPFPFSGMVTGVRHNIHVWSRRALLTVCDEYPLQGSNIDDSVHSSSVFRRVSIYAYFCRLICLLVFSQFFSCSYSIAKPFMTLTIEFQRVECRDSSADSASGVIYYQWPDYVFVKVVEPNKQSIVLRNSTMVIYYPNETRAFQFSGCNLLSLPFFYAFIAVAFDDLGLSNAGLSVANCEMLGDT